MAIMYYTCSVFLLKEWSEKCILIGHVSIVIICVELGCFLSTQTPSSFVNLILKYNGLVLNYESKLLKLIYLTSDVSTYQNFKLLN